VNRERAIEDAIIAHPEVLGFPGARAIRNVRVAQNCGRVDLMFLPEAGPTRLVLVEAKVTGAPDAASKVVGQLLMYYGGALTIGARGLECLKAFATSPEKALGPTTKSVKQLTCGISPPAVAWEAMSQGEKLNPGEISLFVALNAHPHGALPVALRALREHHGLSVGLIIVENGTPQRTL
jgi:hypothetical protein